MTEASRRPQPAVGDRVVIRYRLGGDAPADWRQAPNPPVVSGPTQSDITGILRERSDEVLVVERDGELHRLPMVAISSVRLLSRRVVRNSEIREVERTLMAAAPAAEHGAVEGWLVNAAPDGAAASLRSTVGAPIEFGSTAAGLPEVVAWLTVRGLPARLLIADRLLRTSALGATPMTSEAYEVLVGPEPNDPELDDPALDEDAPAGDLSLIADGVAAVTVRVDDDRSRTAWRRLGFELHHTCHLLTL